MSFLDSIGGSNLLSIGVEIGLGVATGGSSMLLEGALGAIGSQVVGQLGSELGLSPSEVSVAQTAFSAAFGSSAGLGTALQGLGGSPSQQGQLSSQLSQLEQQLEQQLMQQLQQNSGSNGASSSSDGGDGSGGGSAGGASAGGASGGGGILLVIAEALGKAMDNQLQNMSSLGTQLSQASSQSGSSSSNIGTLTAQMQVASQEMGLIGNALTNVLQSTGDALSGLAKKG